MNGARARRAKSHGWNTWVLAIIIVAVAVVVVAVWTINRGSSEEKFIANGEAVAPFQLPDLVSGQMFSLSNYLGKQDIVIVSYMGWFCPGCQELLVELQGRQADFSSQGVRLVVLGSKPESKELALDRIAKYGITYTLVYDEQTTVTKDIGLWSNMMNMPWMGYMIIDKTGHLAANDLALSEAPGAAPANVNRILEALHTVRAR